MESRYEWFSKFLRLLNVTKTSCYHKYVSYGIPAKDICILNDCKSANIFITLRKHCMSKVTLTRIFPLAHDELYTFSLTLMSSKILMLMIYEKPQYIPDH